MKILWIAAVRQAKVVHTSTQIRAIAIHAMRARSLCLTPTIGLETHSNEIQNMDIQIIIND